MTENETTFSIFTLRRLFYGLLTHGSMPFIASALSYLCTYAPPLYTGLDWELLVVAD